MKFKKHARTVIAVALVASLTWVLTPLAKSSYTYNETPTQNPISDSVEATEPVCFIKESETYFTTIEGALAVANANALSGTSQTVVVIPRVDSDNPGTTPLTWITENCQIGNSTGAEVRLVLTADTDQTENPTVSGTSISNDSSSYAHINTSSKRTFADNTTDDVKTYLKSNVGVEENITITIGSTGELDIGGTIGPGPSDTDYLRPSGHVNGAYTQLTMKSGSSIVSNGGDINLYGFIKEYNSASRSTGIIMNGGTMTQPFVLYDYCGDPVTDVTLTEATAFPINTYDLPSCQVNSRFVYGSSLTGVGGVYSDSSYYTFTASLIGTSDSLFIMESDDEDGYIDITYTAENNGITASPAERGYTTTEMSLNCSCTFGSITFSLAGTSVTTSDYYFPIPYTFDVVVAGGSFSIPYQIKFLLGSSMTIDEGASVTNTAKVIFYQSTEGYSYAYSLGTGGNVTDAAVLINNGTLNINSGIAGFIDTTVVGAKITTTSGWQAYASGYEITAFSGTSSVYSYTNSLVTGRASIMGDPEGTGEYTVYRMGGTNYSFTSAVSDGGIYYWVCSSGKWGFNGTDVTEASSSESTDVDAREPVCFIKESSTYFTTIEAALETANENAAAGTAQTVVVIPTVDADNPGTNPAIWITENCDIGSGSGATVRLVLTADQTQTDAPSYTSGSTVTSFGSSSYAHVNISGRRTFADNTTDNVGTYLKCNVGIAAGVRVRVRLNGQLDIGGTVGPGYTSDQRPTGHVNGEYCQITMQSGSHIDCGGKINLYGYIKEYDLNNRSTGLVMNSGGTLTEPLVFYDYGGGTHSLLCANNTAFPMNTYDLPSCQVNSRFKYGSHLTGVGGAYASSAYYMMSAELIGTTSGLFRMSSDDTSSYIDIKYTAKTNGITVEPKGSSSTNAHKSTVMTMNGACSFGSMTLSLAGESVETSSYYFPIPYTFDITVESGSLSIPYQVKFLLGSSLTINEGAEVTVSADTVFYQSTAGYSYSYNLGCGGAPNVKNTAAVLINNGTLNIDAGIAGYIDTTVVDATITTVESDWKAYTTGNEITAFSGNSSSYTYTKTALTCRASIYGDPESTGDYAVYRMGGTNYSFTSAQNSDGDYYWVCNKGKWGFNGTDVTEAGTSTSDSGSYCVLPGTLITMADGSYKPVEELELGDEVMVFDHATGKTGTSFIVINDHDEANDVFVMALNFSNGKTVKIVSEHGFFDVDLNRYIYIDETNYEDYVGHRFYAFKGNGSTESEIVTLESVFTYWLYSETWSPSTYHHLNIITQDILSMPGGIWPLINYFELDENMKVIPQLMKKDIEEYGLYDYEDWKEYITEEEFDAYNVRYLKVAIGKGITTRKGLVQLVHNILKR